MKCTSEEVGKDGVVKQCNRTAKFRIAWPGCLPSMAACGKHINRYRNNGLTLFIIKEIRR